MSKMFLLDVYHFFFLKLKNGYGAYIFDKKGNSYLDFYGGHAVIAIGHGHNYYVHALKKQLSKIGYYSNIILNLKQRKIAKKITDFYQKKKYHFFLANSGTEVVENALKVLSIHNGKKRIITFKSSFHGRSSAAISLTDNLKILSPLNEKHSHIFFSHGNELSFISELEKREICAVIIEGIQGVAGIFHPGIDFFTKLERNCSRYKVPLILDEIQSGYGRSGSFFSHQKAKISPDLITIAKGMGNGFPIAGILVSPQLKAFYSMLGTTFGGNYLACVAALSVLMIIKKEKIIKNLKKIGVICVTSLKKMFQVKNIGGSGLIIGIHFKFSVFFIRKYLLLKENIFIGIASNLFILRLLPPLNISYKEIVFLFKKLQNSLVFIESDLLSI